MLGGEPLPTGTVTFVFTDVEGSTRLAQQYPDALPALLARHNEILIESAQLYHGYVFRTVGDAFCMAFHSAPEALNAAVRAQQLLHDEAWTPAPIKVRMGVHTGRAVLQDGRDYEGYLTLSRAQRLMSAAHGGQVLISMTTRHLLREELPPGLALRDLGEWRLKDLLHPERIFQLVVPGLPADFPSITALNAYRHNIPAELTRLIGREQEMTEIGRILVDYRLVTLTGSGGVGKTRLALALARQCLERFAGGVWVANLAPITSPELVPQTLLSLFGLQEDSSRRPLEALTDYIGQKSLLLLLDNCEHLILSCAELSEALLLACPGLHILATSREPLGIPGEVAYRVSSLETPDVDHLPALAELERMSSIKLFAERAAAAKPAFMLTNENAPAIARICFRLGGIPLALELAASMVNALSPAQIASRLDDRFNLLTRGSRNALPRQQTLRATIDWSYSLLSEEEKILFRRLAVFAGGWTLEGAEKVCNEPGTGLNVLELLTRLVDKSLVSVDGSEEDIRYHRLETIRQYAHEKLRETHEVDALRDRHLDYFAGFAERADRGLKGAQQTQWQKRVSLELGNLRAALEWSLSRVPDSALRIAGALNLFWTAGGFSAEGFRWTQRALEEVSRTPLQLEAPAQERLLARARALCSLSRLYLSLGENANAERAAAESVELYRGSPDANGLAFSLVILAYPLEFLGEHLRAQEVLQEGYAIARAQANVYVMCRALNRLARVIIDLYHDLELSRGYAEESIRLARPAGLRSQEAQAIEALGLVAAQARQYDEARARFQDSLRIYDELGATFNVVLEKANLAHLERRLGNYDVALDYYRETIVAFRDIGQRGAVSHQLECFAFIAAAQNESERALRLLAAATALREKNGTPMTPDEQVYFDGQLAGLRGRVDARRYEALWSRASTLSMEQAIDLALSS